MVESSSRNTDLDWVEIAAKNPYWGVLSIDDFRGDDISETARAKFLASGAHLITNLMAFIRRHLKSDFRPNRSLDFGCGVGRLTVPISKISEVTVGVDIAPRMLEIAREITASSGITNASFVLSDDELSQVEGSFDFINTCIVLQHIPPDRGYRILANLLARLRKGGIGSIQLTYGKSRRFLQHETTRAKYYRREGRALIDLVADTFQDPPRGTIVMFDYDLNEIFAILSEISGTPILTLPTFDDDHLGLHLVFMRAR
jgi:SAM-dependent methyltransferase